MTDSTDFSSALMPMPVRLELDGGAPLPAGRPLDPVYAAIRTPRLERAVARFLTARSAGEGAGARVTLTIECRSRNGAFPALDEDESYTIAISGEAVRVTAPGEWGVLRALATLTQLYGGAGAEGSIPALRIEDRPRFPWRGLMLDVARHFIPQPDLRRTLNAMAVFKLNVLHLHLSDDQAFRFPSRRYPRLPSTEHYSRQELAALIAHAGDRGIRVVPELDVPGHTASWLAAYPAWGNREAEASRRFGVHRECLDPTRPEVLDAVTDLFAELADVFPDSCLHIGGDEVHPAWWSGDERIQAFMKEHGLEDVPALQGWFNAHLTAAIRRMGRRPLGWDEVLHAGLPREVTVQAWRGATARHRALVSGHDCIMSAPYYLDLFYPADVHYGFDPAAPVDELLDHEDALEEDARFAHVAGGMAWTRQWRNLEADQVPGAGAGRLLGAEACLWSELVDARTLDVRLWSRMPALAERFWSPAECRETEDVYARLSAVLDRLPVWAGVDVPGDCRHLTREAGLEESWRVLADLLEPVKWYGRLLGQEALAARLEGREMPQSRPYRTDTPLDRVVDGLPPESLEARRLADVLKREAAGDAAARAELLETARHWRELPENGGPAELEEAARRLRRLGHLVREVLGGELPAREARALIAEACQPVGEYLLAAAFVLDRWLARRLETETGDDGRRG